MFYAGVEQMEANIRGVIKGSRIDESFLDGFLARDGAVVFFVLGGGGEDGPVQFLILAEAFGEHVAAEVADAAFVVVPGGGFGDAGDITTDDELQGELLAFVDNHDAGIGDGDDVVWDDGFCLFEPEGGELVKDLPLEGNGADDAVECRYPVGGNQDSAIALNVAFADFSLVSFAEAFERGGVQGAFQFSFNAGFRNHGVVLSLVDTMEIV